MKLPNRTTYSKTLISYKSTTDQGTMIRGMTQNLQTPSCGKIVWKISLFRREQPREENYPLSQIWQLAQ